MSLNSSHHQREAKIGNRQGTSPGPHFHTNSVAKPQTRRIVVLTEGHSNPVEAKTAASVIRYRPGEVVAVLDSHSAGKPCDLLLGVGESIPVVGSLQEIPEANTLLIGIAPSGGKIPEAWRSIVLQALASGMDVVSGLHDFLSNDLEFAAAAKENNAQLIDVRKNCESDVARFDGFRDDCLRILTVGQDCSLGKMLVTIELTKALKNAGHDAKFIATGQTGIMIAGEGCPIDCVVSDFVSGSVEKMILANQHHDILMIEGQGSLVHPKYSGVTLSLLHGSAPQGMILCYEVGRKAIHGMPHVPITPLSKVKEAFEMMANLLAPSKVIGIAMNSSTISAQEAAEERECIRQEFGLPVCDVVRDGPQELLDAVVACKAAACSTK